MKKEPKILVEFSLLPESKRQLKTYLDDHIHELTSARASDHARAMKGLKQAIKDTFPPEALAEFKTILAGKSEYALMVHNCPEAKQLEWKIDPPRAEEAYSFHLGNALYEMNKAEHVRAVLLTRNAHHPDGRNQWHDGVGVVHRDSIENSADGRKAVGQYIIFSSPRNDEHALTEIVHVKHAVESLSLEQRKKVQCFINDRDAVQHEDAHVNTLQDLFKALKKSVSSHSFVKAISLISDPAKNTEAALFVDALKTHSTKVDLQPGDLLVVNENHLFHRAFPGDKEKIAQIPLEQHYSRLLLHNAGAPHSSR